LHQSYKLKKIWETEKSNLSLPFSLLPLLSLSGQQEIGLRLAVESLQWIGLWATGEICNNYANEFG